MALRILVAVLLGILQPAALLSQQAATRNRSVAGSPRAVQLGRRLGAPALEIWSQKLFD
jgi:hypothetical protein